MTLRISSSLRGAVAAIALGAALACTAPAFAAPSPADGASPDAALGGVRPVVGVLLTGTVGKEKVGVDNPDGSSVSGSLSGRYEAFAGAQFPVDPNGLALRLTVGLHATGSLKGTHGSEHATSIPLEATLWYPVNDKLQLGGGVRYAMHTRFSGAGNKTGDGLHATPGPVFGVGYRWSRTCCSTCATSTNATNRPAASISRPAIGARG